MPPGTALALASGPRQRSRLDAAKMAPTAGAAVAGAPHESSEAALPVAPVLVLIVAAVVANLRRDGASSSSRRCSAGRARSRARSRRAIDAERRAAEAAVVGGTRGLDRRRRCLDRRPTTGSCGSSPGSSCSTTTAIVAATGLWPETQPAIFDPARLLRAVRRGRPRPAPGGRARAGQVRRRGLGRDHGRDAPRRADRRRRQPVLLRLPAHRRRRRARGLADRSRSRSPRRRASATSLAVVAGSRRGPLGPATAATVGVNLTALILLAYVAMVIAREQRRTRDAAIRLSTVDSLTGLFNRTFFFAAIDREIARSARSGRGFCLLMMDLDELKAINDRLGHFQGDRVLRGVGEVITAGRPPDRHRGPLRRRRVRRRSCPRPIRPAPSCWPRRSGSASTRWRSSCPVGSPDRRSRSAS